MHLGVSKYFLSQKFLYNTFDENQNKNRYGVFLTSNKYVVVWKKNHYLGKNMFDGNNVFLASI